MPRLTKCRRVCAEPINKIFQVEGFSGAANILRVEELESIRLADLENLDQDEAAKRMDISRGTFQRILYVARHKVAEALVKGKTIVIEGGNYEISNEHCENEVVCNYCRLREENEGDENNG